MRSQTEVMSASDLYSHDLLGKAKEFWYKFDNRYEGKEFDVEVKKLYLNCYLMKSMDPDIYNLDWMFSFLRNEMRADPQNYEQSFSTEVQKYKDGIMKLANDQRGIIDNYLKSSFEIQQAFELFGQGVLYDERRRTVHKMDGSDPFVGYARWHGFIRARVSVGQDIDYWLKLDRYLLIAYMLQSKLKPPETKQDNPYILKKDLSNYQSSCLSFDFKKLDEEFIHYFS
ncbi:MAG TPA: hypothetical protein VH500_00295 [Nitrososphaeraceae archaeon]